MPRWRIAVTFIFNIISNVFNYILNNIKYY